MESKINLNKYTLEKLYESAKSIERYATLYRAKEIDGIIVKRENELPPKGLKDNT
ncbi:hypothetical protein [Pseudoalteromonas spongiae]|uniref:hypothetical protein n=1 Tax=Pseudoalteromonas spongiae TaxID=298657 RepID=UPI00026CB7CF|nr:hypothetical protein [Pseudoalteromonas spongiae]ATC98993.1 hypothetical protein PSPO_a1976 [Pseudoalteromonas spongiae UST010723-006]